MAQLMYGLSNDPHRVMSALGNLAMLVEGYATGGASAVRGFSNYGKSNLRRSLERRPVGRQNTSAISMAYGKRRNSRFKRRNNYRSKSRKRPVKRRRKAGKGSANMLSAIHKALSGTMGY